MNTPNPLVPQGTFANRGKSPVPLTVFAILAVHVVLLGLLLIAGCNRKPSVDTAQDNSALPPVPPPPAVDNWPAAPTSSVPPVASTDVPPVPPPPPPPVDLQPPTPPVAVTPTPDAPATSPGLSEHTISKGESFYTLGKKYGVGYKAIVDANPNLNPNRLRIGDKVKIPPPRPAGAMTVNATAAPGDGTRTYKVKSGDNLLKIASTFGVGVKQLRAANNLRTDQIRVGQVLKIPAKQPVAEAVPPPAVLPPANPQ